MRIFEIEPGQKRKTPRADHIIMSEEHFERVWNKLIVPNCSEVLDIYRSTNKILYRGSKNNPDIYRGRSFNDRDPTDSNAFLSKIFDKMLVANGMTALRSNSVFATSSRTHAGGFGEIYAFFPVNGFKFTYTSYRDIVIDKWEDFISYDDERELNAKYAEVLRKNGHDVRWGANWMQGLDTVPTKDRLAYAINRIQEMIPNDPEIQGLTIDKLITPEFFAKKYEPKNTDLGYALENSKEVYVQGQYYAMVNSIYGPMIRNKLAGL